MKSTNRKRALLTSSSVILLCMTVVVGMTWALFTDTKTITNHLQAGDMSITLSRTGLVKTTLDQNGYLNEVTVQSASDSPEYFTEPTETNVFGLKTDEQGNVTEKIVPGSKFVSTMKIQNNSDVAFGYWIRIDCKNSDEAKALAEQLVITVYTDKNGDGTIDLNSEKDSKAVSDELSVGSDTDHISVIDIGASETFIVSAEFVDKGYSYAGGALGSLNDDAKNQTVGFDLVVHAVQVKKATVTS